MIAELTGEFGGAVDHIESRLLANTALARLAGAKLNSMIAPANGAAS